MYANAGYLPGLRVPFKDKSKPLIVGSCGTYRMITKERFPTWRPKGRLDFQLLYIASGKAHFFLNGVDTEVAAGHMVLFQPRQEQHYEYYSKDKTEAYWVHFTGSNVKNILRKYEIPLTDNVFYCGSSGRYASLFKEIIHELQTCQPGYQELTEMYLRQLFLAIQRSQLEQNIDVNSALQEEMKFARRYFADHYNEPISIEDFAHSRNMSVSWFLRNFRQTSHQSPMQYILNLRMNNAVSLLESTDNTITEIAAIVGYDNPLYFSRIFKKMKGVSPVNYRKMLRRSTGEE